MSESEAIKITLVRGDKGLGFNVRGGTDIPHLPNDNGIFITRIREDGAAAKDGRLKEGDKILEINGKSIVNVTHNEAVNTFLDAGDKVTLKVIPGAAAKIMARAEGKGAGGAGSGIAIAIGTLAALGLIGFLVTKQ